MVVDRAVGWVSESGLDQGWAELGPVSVWAVDVDVDAAESVAGWALAVAALAVAVASAKVKV